MCASGVESRIGRRQRNATFDFRDLARGCDRLVALAHAENYLLVVVGIKHRSLRQIISYTAPTLSGDDDVVQRLVTASAGLHARLPIVP